MRSPLFAAILCLLLSGIASAQTRTTGIGLLEQDTSLPVEVTSETLTVEDTAGFAVFEGNVVVVQGPMRLTAPWIRVDYTETEEGGTAITEMNARGGVTFTNGPEAAESNEATYRPEDGDLLMTGDVILVQGPSVMEGEKLTVDLALGTGLMEGGVRTVFQESEGN